MQAGAALFRWRPLHGRCAASVLASLLTRLRLRRCSSSPPARRRCARAPSSAACSRSFLPTRHASLAWRSGCRPAVLQRSTSQRRASQLPNTLPPSWSFAAGGPPHAGRAAPKLYRHSAVRPAPRPPHRRRRGRGGQRRRRHRGRGKRRRRGSCCRGAGAGGCVAAGGLRLVWAGDCASGERSRAACAHPTALAYSLPAAAATPALQSRRSSRSLCS